jgi:hypothetical protein
MPASPGPLKHWNCGYELFLCSLVGTQNAELIWYCAIIHYISKDDKLTASYRCLLPQHVNKASG